jgi:hypothetical protein
MAGSLVKAHIVGGMYHLDFKAKEQEIRKEVTSTAEMTKNN